MNFINLLLAFVGISLLGTLLHFVYFNSGKKLIIGLIAPINESVWEHLKMGVIPTYVWGLVSSFVMFDEPNMWISMLVSMAVFMLVIPLVFYVYTFFTKKPILAVDICIFYFTVLLSQLIAQMILASFAMPYIVTIVCIALVHALLAVFVFFSLFPPKCKIFLDPVSNTYGLLSDFKAKRQAKKAEKSAKKSPIAPTVEAMKSEKSGKEPAENLAPADKVANVETQEAKPLVVEATLAEKEGQIAEKVDEKEDKDKGIPNLVDAYRRFSEA